MSGLAGKRALVKVSGTPVAFTSEATTDSGDHQTYQITDPLKRVWDRATALVVKVGGTVTGESYTFNRLTGKVTFASVNAGRAAVTLTGAYIPLSVAVGGKSFSIQIAVNTLDDSDFDGVNTASGFATKQIGTKDVSGSVSKWAATTDTYFRSALLQGDPVVIEFFSDRTASTPTFTCWALIDKDSLSAPQDGLIEDSITFTGAADDQGVVVA